MHWLGIADNMPNADQNWEQIAQHAIRSAFKKYAKKHRAEYESCFENLDRVMEVLSKGHAWGSFQLGFLRSEGDGVFRIGQTGVPHARETRLYVYVDADQCQIFLLTIGDKDSQQDDLLQAKAIAQTIRGK